LFNDLLKTDRTVPGRGMVPFARGRPPPRKTYPAQRFKDYRRRLWASLPRQEISRASVGRRRRPGSGQPAHRRKTGPGNSSMIARPKPFRAASARWINLVAGDDSQHYQSAQTKSNRHWQNASADRASLASAQVLVGRHSSVPDANLNECDRSLAKKDGETITLVRRARDRPATMAAELLNEKAGD